MRKPAHLKNLLLLCLLVAGMSLVVAALPALAQDATAEATAEMTAEATTEATAEATAEMTAEATVEATVEATAEIVPTEVPTATPEPEVSGIEEAPGLAKGVLVVGFVAVLFVGGIAWFRQRGGKNDDKV